MPPPEGTSTGGQPRVWLAQAQSSAATAPRPTRPDPAAATLAQLKHYADAATDAPPVARCKEPRSAAVRLDLEADVLDVLRRCSTIHLEDKEAEKKKRWLTGVGVVVIVLTVIAFFAHAFAVGAIGVLVAAIGFAWRSFVDGKDIEDRKLDVVSGLLARLGSELDLGRPVKVRVDFKGYDQQPRQKGLGRDSFEHEWLGLSFVLADDTRVHIAATQTVMRKERHKPKYTKVKDRSRERLDVRLVAPKGKGFRPASVDDGRQVAGLLPRRVVVQPRYAEFQFFTAPTQRIRDRGSWSASGLENELDGPRVFAAVVASYKLAARAERAPA